LATIEAAMKRLETEARAAADAERQRREEAEAQRQRTGTKRRGRAPGPIVETPAEKAQTNFTEPELPIMKTANKGWDCCGNAQISVDDGCQIILACDVTDQCNDKQQAEPMAQATRDQLDQAGIAPADESGAAAIRRADTGYFSGAVAAGSIRIATERQQHLATSPAVGGATVTAQKMQAKLKTTGSCGVRPAEGGRRAGLRPDQGGGLAVLLRPAQIRGNGGWCA
jgi:hypothetical protein